MKFRAISSDCEQIQYLFKVFQSICKVSDNHLIMKLSENEIELISDSKQRFGAFVVKCHINSDDFFQEYCFCGLNNENNLIYFNIVCESLSQVLNSLLPNMKSIKLKLSNRDGKTVLSIEVEYPTNDMSENRWIRHDIRIGLIQRKYWHSIDETDFGPFDLSLYLPEFKILGTTIERMTNICHYVIISAKAQDNKGIVTIGVETESIALKSKFTQLELNLNNELSSNQSQSQDNQRIQVRIDARKLNHIFSSLNNLKPSSIICSLVNDQKIHFKFFHNFVNFQAIVPNVAL